MRLEAQEARRIGEHRPRIGLSESLAAEKLEKRLRMTPAHVGVALALVRAVAEMAPAVDHLFGRAAADAELQPAAGDEVGGARVLDHVERVLVAHVDDGGADLDALRPRADRRQEREGRSELAGEMMDAEIGAVRAEVLGGDGEVDRLQERVGARARRRLRRGRPVAERKEADFFHAGHLTGFPASGRRFAGSREARSSAGMSAGPRALAARRRRRLGGLRLGRRLLRDRPSSRRCITT